MNKYPDTNFSMPPFTLKRLEIDKTKSLCMHGYTTTMYIMSISTVKFHQRQVNDRTNNNNIEELMKGNSVYTAVKSKENIA